MFTDIEQSLPEQWRGFFRVLSFPIAWLFPFQNFLLGSIWSSDLAGVSLAKRLFLLMPALGIVAGLWCTMLGIYTLLFRGRRAHFIGTVMILWWDLARCTWIFWAGMGKFVIVAIGTVWGVIRLLVETLLEMIRELIELPFVLTGNLSRSLRQPGVPWLAFLMTLAWSALEATIFTYILSPTIGEIVSDLTGADTHRFLGVFLFLMLLAMVSGSLACMYVLVDAIKRRDIPQALQMLIVEFFVMFVEVMFLYRELVDALTPWIAQQTGMQMGIVPVITLSTFGWLGIRGMVWFLFARFGTPTLIAIIARQRLPEEAVAENPVVASEQRWDMVVAKLKAEQDWFSQKSQALLEAAILPSFQLLAAAINFSITLFSGEPLFSLPFKSLSDVQETKALLQQLAGRGNAQ
ncbi:MAG: hypothetical protein HY077_02825 [Elusimicrobia bacterium]|nr:hypothetical protein [Elusimicrobiota bacterium]